MWVEVFEDLKIQGDTVTNLLCLTECNWHKCSPNVYVNTIRLLRVDVKVLGVFIWSPYVLWGGCVGFLMFLWLTNCGSYVMLGKITRPQHIYKVSEKVYKVSEGLKAPYRHIRDIVFHTFNILFHRYVENSFIFFNTFLIDFNILLSLYCTFRQ